MAVSSLVKHLSLSVLGAACLTVGVMNSAEAANLVSNGGFETGDFSGWTRSGNLGATFVSSNAVNSGTYSGQLGPVRSLGFLSQSLATVVGQAYTLSFFLNSDGGLPNVFQAIVNGVTVFNQSNIAAQPFTRYSYNFLATSSSTDLTFGFQNNPSYVYLDDVIVSGASTAVPTPALLPGLVGLGVAALRKRKGETTEAV
jgi:hypothetical protein